MQPVWSSYSDYDTLPPPHILILTAPYFTKIHCSAIMLHYVAMDVGIGKQTAASYGPSF